MIPVANHELLVERFGRWPSFHDAEVQAVRLDSGQRAEEDPSLELDIHVFEVEGVVEPDGHFRCVLHTLVTLRSEAVEEVELHWFGMQNVLAQLTIETVTDGDGAPKLHVELPSSYGLEGTFSCRGASVTGVDEFEPGPRSVY